MGSVLCESWLRSEHQTEERNIEKEAWPFAALLGSASLLLRGNLTYDRLIQAALRQQLRAFAIHRLQQNLSRPVDERHAAQIHLKLFVRRVATHLPPALLQHGHAGARQTTLYI